MLVTSEQQAVAEEYEVLLLRVFFVTLLVCVCAAVWIVLIAVFPSLGPTPNVPADSAPTPGAPTGSASAAGAAVSLAVALIALIKGIKDKLKDKVECRLAVERGALTLLPLLLDERNELLGCLPQGAGASASSVQPYLDGLQEPERQKAYECISRRYIEKRGSAAEKRPEFASPAISAALLRPWLLSPKEEMSLSPLEVNLGWLRAKYEELSIDLEKPGVVHQQRHGRLILQIFFTLDVSVEDTWNALRAAAALHGHHSDEQCVDYVYSKIKNRPLSARVLPEKDGDEKQQLRAKARLKTEVTARYIRRYP